MFKFDDVFNSQPQAREKATKEGFDVSVAKTSFKGNTKALAENEGEGLAKVISLHTCLNQYAKLTYFLLVHEVLRLL